MRVWQALDQRDICVVNEQDTEHRTQQKWENSSFTQKKKAESETSGIKKKTNAIVYILVEIKYYFIHKKMHLNPFFKETASKQTGVVSATEKPFHFIFILTLTNVEMSFKSNMNRPISIIKGQML